MNRKDFTLLETITYLDHAAASLKPTSVIDAGSDFYHNSPINLHSIDSALGVEVYNKVKEVRESIAKLNNAEFDEVIFTSGTTDGLNKIANMLESKINEKDEIILDYLNHSSNVVPWIELAKKVGAKIIWTSDPLSSISQKTKIVAISEMNNTIGNHDLEKIYKTTSRIGAYLVNDAAQAISHKFVDSANADFTVWSSNKFYGPTGIGVMIIRKKVLETLTPSTFGGGAVSEYSGSSWIPNESVHAFEPGTLNAAGIVMMGAAIKYLENIGWEKIWKHENKISEYAFKKLSKLENIIWASKEVSSNLLFNIKGHSAQDVVSHLGHKGVIVRAGQHCVKTIKEATKENSWIRVSIGLYNEKKDIDSLYKEIAEGGDFFDFF